MTKIPTPTSLKLEWWESAACIGVPQPDWLPREIEEDEDPEAFRKVVEAHSKHFVETSCNVCPVRVPCFAYSMRKRIPFGVWGGVNQVVRVRWLKAGRKWRCQVCGTAVDPLDLIENKDCDRCSIHRGGT